MTEVISCRCPARVGLLGNPSDGFCGKTLSFALGNYHAEVRLEKADGVTIVPNPELDKFSFDSIRDLSVYTSINGYYGGVRLLQATIKAFYEACSAATANIDTSKGFRVSYSSTIPRMVGLSGSSAIITATFNALLLFYGITIEDLDMRRADFPLFILNIERKELGIAAGLQDRVIQTYRGLVFMDFSGDHDGEQEMDSCPFLSSLACEKVSEGSGVYFPLEHSLAPCLYLAYNLSAAGDSGKVHSTVKERWLRRDPELVAGMQELAAVAHRGVQALVDKDYETFARLMETNFATRRRLYGDEVVGATNIDIIQLAAESHLSGKFTGSGGAVVLLRHQPGAAGTWLDPEEEMKVTKKFADKGFHFERVEIALPQVR